jgi:hypothetical protein
MLLALLFACVTEDNFPARVAAVSCAGAEECDGEAFADTYASQSECREEQVDLLSGFHDCYVEHCTFDAKVAGEYLSNVRSADCGGRDDALAEAEDIYTDCTDELELAACLLDAAF